MPAKKPSQTPKTPAPRKSPPATKTAPPAPESQPAGKFQRPAPTKVYRPQVVTHVKTMSNGQPRPKSRRTK